MRWVTLIFLLVLVAGCGARSPAIPDTSPQPTLGSTVDTAPTGPYRLFGEWSLYINSEHDRVDLVPKRQERFHLNVLKFLEDYCSDCLEITGLHNNGDSTFDLTVRITHPFPGFPEYTGFDVKGIIMFDGSWEMMGYQYYAPYPEPFRVSWRGLGDPQVLNADGYTLRWSPWYDSGLSQPVFNYWEGRYASGTPTANVNAFLNFYTGEDRHVFRDDGIVSRTYHIWLPPGEPIVAGYAVEACWEPPLFTPVTNPITDFPITANQPEAYEFYYNLNNGNPITDPTCCGDNWDPSDAFMFSKYWYEPTYNGYAFFCASHFHHGYTWDPCGDEWPNMYCNYMFVASAIPDGDYIGVAINYYGPPSAPYAARPAYNVVEFTIDLE